MKLSFLEPLYKHPGPYASVYLDTTRNVEYAHKAIALRWRAIREQLAEQGADAQTLDAIENLIGSDRDLGGPHGQAIFAAGGEVVYLEEIPAPPRRQIGRWAPLPHTMPLVAQRGERIPHLLVTVDRVGADIRAWTVDEIQEERHVDGADFPIRKVQPGGWSQPRYQRRAENTWEHNAAGVAEEVERVAARIGAAVIVVAGDVRARALLHEHLQKPWRERVVELDTHGRAAGIDADSLIEEHHQVVTRKVAEQRAQLLDEFRRERGHHHRAVEGLGATAGALMMSQVDVLLLNDHPESNLELWVGPEPTQLALFEEDLRNNGVETPVRDRADAALIRALVATNARLVIVPREELELIDGVGAVLRFGGA
ncbi:hypothetical protein TH66_23025 [Carbonactinospora thermoautotrophica]|uniref:Peptide chain release factor 1 n=1 Tax=Carbonactinospora thermoautotrophica TaxID=1469144 RepID=A0A132MKD9_9ACTN|nr:Vms1/Ankzf1 family peptidyl-tRNA hydrolase [Carbonactinospora thermoautotrophica]KWW98342.1 hypothetical protein TH66_23025 [Carbonactinospora thermoautotrophica]KWX02860.1 hypothetical protein LI90_3907 [Carbonactinospora thermoautotrophica]KWX10116.1 hypothetical protein TR74_05555 [Carbonactinospora thermoautotrophica]